MTRRIRRDRLAELFRSVHHSHSAARRADECAETKVLKETVRIGWAPNTDGHVEQE
jgi:hypothetical protein